MQTTNKINVAYIDPMWRSRLLRERSRRTLPLLRQGRHTNQRLNEGHINNAKKNPVIDGKDSPEVTMMVIEMATIVA